MSRFSFRHQDNPVIEIAYGYDRPLQQYFYQEFDTSVDDEVDEGYMIEDLGTSSLGSTTVVSRMKIADKLIEAGMPEGHPHINSIALDLPFPEDDSVHVEIGYYTGFEINKERN